MSETYDLAVIGGGINGAGIARDAAGRGLKVVLCEAKDLAQATSSASTKLIHGGLRYLEHYEFRLVREALHEREVLLRSAPHIIWPLEFILPHNKHLRSRWLIRLGLFLYDHLGGRKILPPSKGVGLKTHAYGAPLKDKIKRGFSYADCWVEDSRLVVLNARDAANKGADILPYTACKGVMQDGEVWHVETERGAIQSRAVVNATGPWVRQSLENWGLVQPDNRTKSVRLVKGSHIIVPKLYDGDQAYILQHSDGRVVFVIPYERDYSLIGTTDVDYDGDPYNCEITDQEIHYLLHVVNFYFKDTIVKQDVVWSYSGVRPLMDDGQNSASSVTRDYELDLAMHGRLPLLNVFGGKLTTYRELSEKAVDKICGALGHNARPWTEGAHLPGGDIPAAGFDIWFKTQCQNYGWMPKPLLHRYARAYGTEIHVLLKGRHSLTDLGGYFGDDIYEAELVHLITQEWARSVDDVLWRRSKLGLHVGEETLKILEENFPQMVEHYVGSEESRQAI